VSLESRLLGFETDAERGEKLREEVGVKLADLNSSLTSDISEMIRTMFTSDKQFENALRERLNKASTSNTEFILTQAGQKFKVSDIDPKSVLNDRELSGFEEEKLRKLRETLGEIETYAKAALGVVRRERSMLTEFAKEAKSVAEELRRDLRKAPENKKVTEVEGQIADFESRSSRISAAESELVSMQDEAAKLMQTASEAQRIIDSVTKRSDLEDILTAAAGGFGVSAAIAALVGSMGAAGILALPALVAFALSRIVKLLKQAVGDD
jgi:hypothetical protein